MTFKKYLSINVICGKLSYRAFEFFRLHNEYDDIELLKCELDYLKNIVDNHSTYFEEAFIRLRDMYRLLDGSVQEYEKIIGDLIALDSEYKDGDNKDVIIHNFCKNWDKFCMLNNKNIKFFKIMDSSYSIRINDSMGFRKYEANTSNSLKYSLSVFMLTVINGNNKKYKGNTVLFVMGNEDKVRKVYRVKDVKNTKTLKEIIIEQMKKDIYLMIVGDINKVVEALNGEG